MAAYSDKTKPASTRLNLAIRNALKPGIAVSLAAVGLAMTTLPAISATGAESSLTISRSATTPQGRILVIVDPSVAKQIRPRHNKRANIHQFILDGADNGIEQISQILSQEKGLAAVHILTRGGNDYITLGTEVLEPTTLGYYSALLKSWKAAVAANGQLVLHVEGIASNSLLQTELREISGIELTVANLSSKDDKWMLKRGAVTPGRFIVGDGSGGGGGGDYGAGGLNGGGTGGAGGGDSDELSGTNGNDVIFGDGSGGGGGGRALMTGAHLGGPGGSGSDGISGGAGNDILFGDGIAGSTSGRSFPNSGGYGGMGGAGGGGGGGGTYFFDVGGMQYSQAGGAGGIGAGAGGGGGNGLGADGGFGGGGGGGGSNISNGFGGSFGATDGTYGGATTLGGGGGGGFFGRGGINGEMTTIDGIGGDGGMPTIPGSGNGGAGGTVDGGGGGGFGGGDGGIGGDGTYGSAGNGGNGGTNAYYIGDDINSTIFNSVKTGVDMGAYDGLNTGGGNDFLDGGAGSDDLFGFGGSNIFSFEMADAAGDVDTIHDFNAGTNNLIELRQLSSTFNSATINTFLGAQTALPSAADRTLTLGCAGQLTLVVKAIGRDLIISDFATGPAQCNLPPVAQDDAFMTAANSVLNGNVIADNGNGVDSDPDMGTFSVARLNGNPSDIGAQISLPSGALLAVNAVGDMSYDPNSSFTSLAPGQNGMDSFTYILEDSQMAQSNPATVSITVSGINDPPSVIRNIEGHTYRGGSLLIDNSLLLGSDPDDLPTGLTYNLSSNPANGELQASNQSGPITSFTQDDIDNDRIRYIHDGSVNISDNFGFSLADGGEDGAMAVSGIFSINIEAIFFSEFE